MKKGLRSAGLLLAMLLALETIALGQESKGYSHVRVVRLSFVDGTVLVRRPGATEWAKASVNTPIEQGFSVSTSTGSFAEVEFENGSTARLGQLSELGFPELALSPNGDKINHLALNQGYATFRLAPHHGDVYSVAVANTTLTPSGTAEFRTDFTQGRLRVEVFNGSVDAASPSQTAKLSKGKVLEYASNTETAFNIGRGIQTDAWDNWVHQRDAQAQLAWNDQPVGLNSPVYGWNDLDEYGEWAYLPGYGYGWSPFAPMGWSPYSMGQWSWYPGFGYTWISAEPWGWLPFHTGYWNFAPGFGYFWMPGNLGAWNPALVSWYSGPGYIGWAPLGAGGSPVCSTATCVTAVKPATLQNGAAVNQDTKLAVNEDHATRIAAPNVTPSALAMLSGTPVSQGAVYPGMAGGGLLRQSGAEAKSALAPAIVLMGQSPLEQSTETNAATHKSFFSRSSKARPLHARLGNTLGGQYVVQRGGEQGSAAGPRAMTESRPVFLSHRSSPGYSMPGPQVQRGAFRMEDGGRIVSSAPRSGNEEGFHAAPSMGAAASSAPSVSSEAAHSAPSGGGAHR